MRNFIWKWKFRIFLKETFMLLGKQFFENFDRFQAYNSSVDKKIEYKIIFKKEFCKENGTSFFVQS